MDWGRLLSKSMLLFRCASSTLEGFGLPSSRLILIYSVSVQMEGSWRLNRWERWEKKSSLETREEG